MIGAVMSSKKLAVFCLLLLGLCNGASAQVLCEPVCTGQIDGEKVPDPQDCTKYYVCFDEESTPDSIPCGVGLYFNPFTHECELNIPPCIALCPPIGGNDNCSLTCKNQGDLINDPFNCSIYYECKIGGVVPEVCSGSTSYFNINTYACDSDPSVCCKPSCSPYCHAGGVRYCAKT